MGRGPASRLCETRDPSYLYLSYYNHLLMTINWISPRVIESLCCVRVADLRPDSRQEQSHVLTCNGKDEEGVPCSTCQLTGAGSAPAPGLGLAL